MRFSRSFVLQYAVIKMPLSNWIKTLTSGIPQVRRVEITISFKVEVNLHKHLIYFYLQKG